ncbi:hypothetical protein ACIBG8_07915 [Nonomuraea sp. NPDC050556]|uniref:hypothetical protein n=1 Tax=Nonomuraea sp. NPDC050556 TaxID=3364369 RepID=UPI00379B928B
MKPTRKMWVSAGVVGVIVVGGASVAAAASAGRIEKAAQETKAVVEQQQPAAEPSPTPTTPDFVVSHEVNGDPQKVAEYWTGERMEQAEPMPMPEVVINGEVKPAG